MVKLKNQTLDSFIIKRKFGDTSDNISSNPANQESKRTKASTDEPDEFRNQQEPPISENPRTSPAKRKLMWDYPPNQMKEVRRAYLNSGPFQIHLEHYPAKGSTKHPRKFQYSWFKIFPNWLEYSPTTHSAYCFLCFLYCEKPNVRQGADTFIVGGFDKWKKVNDGTRCVIM